MITIIIPITIIGQWQVNTSTILVSNLFHDPPSSIIKYAPSLVQGRDSQAVHGWIRCPGSNPIVPSYVFVTLSNINPRVYARKINSNNSIKSFITQTGLELGGRYVLGRRVQTNDDTFQRYEVTLHSISTGRASHFRLKMPGFTLAVWEEWKSAIYLRVKTLFIPILALGSNGLNQKISSVTMFFH